MYIYMYTLVCDYACMWDVSVCIQLHEHRENKWKITH